MGERNPKWLQDDYVKFIRYGEWRINKSGQGVLAFITNHGYLDNPTFRGMRQHLLKTFNEIYVLDLHGNSKKREVTPDGSKDENVFDIQQGVAIIIGIKYTSKDLSEEGIVSKVNHYELWGIREGKYLTLQNKSFTEIKWQELKPEKPFLIFSPQNTSLRKEYEGNWQLTKIFPINVLGFQTHRDSFATDFSLTKLKERFQELRNQRITDVDFIRKHGLRDNRDWKFVDVRKKIRDEDNWEKYIVTCSYRPFDDRSVYLNEIATDYPRTVLIRNVANKTNLCLLSSRQQANIGYRHCWISDKPANDCLISTTSREANQVFPLYIYGTLGETKGTLFEQVNENKVPNISTLFIHQFSDKVGLKFISDGQGDLKKDFGPEDIITYIYAILNSPTYRSRYGEFLKIDFPRIPLTSDRELFKILAGKGKELVGLHLLKSSKVEEFITTYPISGDNKVEKVIYIDSKVMINPNQYFGGVPEEVWNFKIGGYQVCDKWLKDRKGRTLTSEDISHYQRIVVALNETIRLMKEIDEVIPGFPIV